MSMQPQHEFLSAEKMQLFLAGLAGLPKDEVKKAKVLFIRNAISEYKAARESMEAFAGMQSGCMGCNPMFWPIMGFQKKAMSSGLRLYEERIKNAIDVWKDDLQGERFDLDFEARDSRDN